jgi:DNA-binding NarL/FixJ family response regulator
MRCVDHVQQSLIRHLADLGLRPEQGATIHSTCSSNTTASDHDSARNAAIRAGAIAYFVKPFDADVFLAAVDQGMA